LTRDELRTEIANNQNFWRDVKAHLEAEITRLRIRNDTLLPEPQRCVLLGRIAAYKYLLTLDFPVPATEQADDLTP
jgi:hypothetical protein